jgi:chromate reductase
VRIVGISGSLRRGSYNTALLDAAAAALPAGAELLRIGELALRRLPFYDEALDPVC